MRYFISLIFIYIIALIIILMTECSSKQEYLSENITCNWVEKYGACFCTWEHHQGGGLTIAPDKVCGRIIMPEMEITPSHENEDTL